MNVRRTGAGFCLVAATALVGYARFFWPGAYGPTAGSSAKLHHRLPPLPVIDAAGKVVDLAQATRGSKSVIVFHSSSCPVCRTVLPELHPFPSSLKLLLVNEDSVSPAADRDQSGVAEALQFSDPNRVLFRFFPMSFLPTVLFVDERGVLCEAWVGARMRGHLARRLIEFADSEP